MYILGILRIEDKEIGKMKDSQQNIQVLKNFEVDMVSGAGFWYNVGKFLAEQANANDAIYAQYGNTNHNR